MASLFAFFREYARPDAARVRPAQIQYSRGDEPLAATLYRPAAARGPLPGFVLLHGLAYYGREHRSLDRFARALAASGFTVMLPDIPEWRQLRVEPAITIPTIRAAVLALDERGDTLPGRVGLLGFSFGGTQGLVAAGADELRGHLRAVASWGGYADLHRVFRFGLTGEHELDGRTYRADPDPYGRWIMAGNYLTGIAGLEHAGATAAALHELALEAGRRMLYAGDVAYDAYKQQLRAQLPDAQRELFDLLAPPAHARMETSERTRTMARELADAALRADPLLDPAPYLPRLQVPTLIAHGRDDRLIPFTESVRLARVLPPSALARCTVTGLFAHSGQTPESLSWAGKGREAARFAALLYAILDLV